ncbi:hypothetical protein BGZ73_004328 [Actinomortierella ambigua]|nr:hypothetical protein BGZ73_004328 [Actinomortierella ambigua]
MRPSTPTPRHPLAEVTFSEECDGIRISEEETLETENQASLQQPSQLFVPPGGDSYSAATDKTTCTPKSPASVSVKSLGIEFDSDTGPSTPLQRPQPPRSASCDERSWSVGPPDPVPDYYRHLQVRRDNRRRRSAPLLRSSPPSCTSSSQFLIGGPTPSGAPSIAMVMDTSTVTTAMEEGGSDLAGLEIGSTSRATRGAGAVDGQRARSSTLQGPYSRDSQEAEEVIAQGGEQGQQPQRPDRRLIRRSMSVLGLQPNLSSLFGKLITTVSSVLPPAHHASVASGVTSESGDSGVSAANGNSSSSSSNLAELAYHTRQQSMTSRRSQELLHNPVVEVGGRISISGRNTPTRDPYEHLRRHPMYQQRLYFYSDCDDDEQLVQQAQSQLHQQPAQAQSSPDSLQRQKQPLEQYQTASQVHEQPLQYTENPMSPSLSPSDRFHSRVCSEATSDHTPPNHTDGNDDEHRHEHGDDDEEEDVGHESLSSRTAAPEDPEDDDDDLPYPRNERVRDDIAADQANQALEEEEEILVASSTSSRPTLSFQRTASALSVASSTLEIPTGAQPSFVDAPPAYATAVASTLKDSTPTSANSTAGTNARRRSEELLRPSSSTSAVHALARASADGFGTIRTSLSSASTTPASTSAHGIPVVTPKKPLTLANLNLSNPPSYWEAVIKYRGFPKIQPRPEESNEILPRYSCSVFREGCINRKTELIGSWRPYRRPWKRTFAHLRGTSLRLYAVDEDDVPRVHIRNISLQLARCELASDYKQRQYVIRIRSTDRTMLMECKDRIDALTWIEYLQAAANIATPLEERCMPKFYTLGRPGGPTSHRSNAHRQDQQQQNSANAGSSSASSQQQAAQTAQREAEELEAQRAHQRSRTTTSAAPRSLSSSSSSIAAASSASPPSPCCTSPPLNPTKHCEHEVDSQSSSQHHDHQHRAQHSQSPHQDHLPAMLSDHRRASSANGVPSSSASSSNSSSLSRSSTNGGIRSLLLRRIGHGNLPASPSPLSSQSRAGEEDGSSGDNGGNHATAEPRPSMERHHSHHHHQDQRRRDRRTVTTLADLARAAGVVAQDHAMPSATSAGSPLMAGQRGVGTGTASIATAAATATTMTASAVAVADDEQVMRAFLQSLGHDDDGDTYRTRSRTLDLSRDRRREHSHQQQEQSSSRALHNDGEDSEEDDDDDEDENMLDDEDIDVEELVERHRRRIRQREQRQRERERRRAAAVAATEAALMMQSSGHGCGRGNLALAETTTTPTTIWRRHSVDMIRRHGGGGGGASGSMHLSVSSSASNSPRSSWHRPLRVLHQLLGQSTTTAVSSVAVVGQSSLQ